MATKSTGRVVPRRHLFLLTSVKEVSMKRKRRPQISLSFIRRTEKLARDFAQMDLSQFKFSVDVGSAREIFEEVADDLSKFVCRSSVYIFEGIFCNSKKIRSRFKLLFGKSDSKNSQDATR